MLEMPLHLHIRSMYRKMRLPALQGIHLFLLIWLVITAWRLDNINAFLHFLPAPAWPAVFNVDRKNHVQKLVWEIGACIFLQLVRCILLLIKALSSFELRTFENFYAYIEHSYTPVLQLSTCGIPPKAVARAQPVGPEGMSKRMRIEHEYQLLLQFFVAKMIASKWQCDFNNSPLAPFFSSYGYLAMWITLQPVTAEASILKRMNMSLRLQEVLGIKKTSVTSYRSTPFKSITHQPDDEKWYQWCAKPAGTFWEVSKDNEDGSDAETTPPSSPILTNALTIFEILGTKRGEEYVSSTADETAIATTNSCTPLIPLLHHVLEHTLTGRPVIRPTSPSRLKSLSAPCLALSRNYIVAPLASKREHDEIEDYGSSARELRRRTANWVPDPEDDENMSEGQVVELPEEKKESKKLRGKLFIPLLTPLRLLDRPWPELSSTLGKRGVETRAHVEDEDRKAWEKWMEKVDGEKMDDVRNFAAEKKDDKMEIQAHLAKKPRLVHAEVFDRFTYTRSLSMPERRAWDPRART